MIDASTLRRLVGGPFVMVVDAARAPDILPLLADLEDEVRVECLWRGRSAEELADVAPYLVDCPPHPAVDDLLRRAWGRSWGIIATCNEGMDGALFHFRRLGMARVGDGGETVYFRYYDPRVMRLFLPICDTTQIDQLFRGIDSLILEDESGAEALICATNGMGRLSVERRPLSNATTPTTVGDGGIWPRQD